MRVHTLPASLALAACVLVASAPQACTASPVVPSASTPRLLTPPASSRVSPWSRPPFQPPVGYRRARAKRQDAATTGQDTTAVVDTGDTDTTEAAATTTAVTTTAAADPAVTTATTTTTSEAVQETTTSPTQAADTTTTASPAAQQSDTAQQETTSTTAATETTTTTPAADPNTSSTATPASSAADSQPVASSESSTSTSSPIAGASSISSIATASSETSQASSSSVSLSDVTSTFTSTITNDDGSVSTSTGTSVTQSAVPIKNNSTSSSTGKTWGIIGGVVGGVVVVAALVFVVYRMTQRRFSNIDNDDVDEFKWPDLQPDGQLLSTNTSTLKPQETHQRGTHGIGDDGDFDSEYGGSGPMGDIRASGAMYAPADVHDPSDRRRESGGGGYPDPFSNAAYGASYEALAMADGGSAAYARGYDPYPAGPIYAAQPQPLEMAYPPSPPQYRSAGSSPYHAQDGFPPHGGAPCAGEPVQHLAKAKSVLGQGTGPQGAPGAAGALRVHSPSPPPPVLPQPVARSESPFEIPALFADEGPHHHLNRDDKAALESEMDRRPSR